MVVAVSGYGVGGGGSYLAAEGYVPTRSGVWRYHGVLALVHEACRQQHPGRKGKGYCLCWRCRGSTAIKRWKTYLHAQLCIRCST